MATQTYIDFKHEEAKALAHLASVYYDIFSAKNLCDYLLRHIDESDYGFADSEILDSFSVAILVRYFRAFGSGVRLNLKFKEIDCFSDSQMKDHQYFKDYRDKYVAHSVNVFESTVVQARYWKEDPYEYGVVGIGESHSRRAGLNVDQIERMKALCETLLIFVTEKQSVEPERLFKVVQNMPMSEILEFGRSVPPNPGEELVTKVQS